MLPRILVDQFGSTINSFSSNRDVLPRGQDRSMSTDLAILLWDRRLEDSAGTPGSLFHAD